MRVLMALAAWLMLAGAVAQPAAAAGGTGQTGSPDPSGGVEGDVLFAGVQYGRAPSRVGGRDGANCTWTPYGEVSGEDVMVLDGVTYLKVVKSCPGTAQTVWVPQVGAATLGKLAASRVTELLEGPTLHSAPPAGKGVVKIGMWVWADPGQYRSQSVTAWVMTAAGPVSATATATPLRLVFEPGEPDGAAMVCAGPGEVWLPAYGDERPSACMYTYQHSSEITDSDTFAATFSIVWQIAWSTTAGGGARLADHVTSTEEEITVIEIQAIVTG